MALISWLPWVAITASAGAFVSGIAAVGSGHRWDFETRDIRQGRVDALLYCWVIASTMLTMIQTYILYRWNLFMRLDPSNWDARRIQSWTYHIFLGLLFITAHVFIRWFLSRDMDNRSYLWGHRRVAD